MLASMFSRPRCGMPMQTSSSSSLAAADRTASTRGITDSPPSRENRFWPTYLVCRNVSKASAALSVRRMRSCSVRSGLSGAVSIPCWIHWRCSGSCMCMYSMPTVRQYASRSTLRTSRRVMNCSPANPATANSRSRSHRVRPWAATSRSGCLRCL